MSDPSATTRFHVAALQPDLRSDRVMPNLHLIRGTVDRLIGEGPLDLVVLPEMFDGSPVDSDGSDVRQFLCTLARSCDVHVVGGSCLMTDPSSVRFNRCYVVGRGGAEIGSYDKRALFSVESDDRRPGASAGVFELGSVRVGVLICADLWHPELARELCGRVDLLAVPAKTGVPSETYREYARVNWQALALVRGMENGMAVVVADWAAGRHDAGRAGLVDAPGRDIGARAPGGRAPSDNAGGPRQTYFTCGAATIVDPSHRPDMKRIQRVVPGGRSTVLRAAIDLDALGRYQAYRRSVGLLPDDAVDP